MSEVEEMTKGAKMSEFRLFSPCQLLYLSCRAHPTKLQLDEGALGVTLQRGIMRNMAEAD